MRSPPGAHRNARLPRADRMGKGSASGAPSTRRVATLAREGDSATARVMALAAGVHAGTR